MLLVVWLPLCKNVPVPSVPTFVSVAVREPPESDTVPLVAVPEPTLSCPTLLMLKLPV